MEKIQRATQSVKNINHDFEILKQNFPHCFDKNGDFDFEKFRKELSKNEVDFSKESYGMDWLGKSYARLIATDSAKTLLKEDTNWNSQEANESSENLLLKGDNLEVLKHLSNAYHEKIKMIYIDPPYNTGSDGFVYEDDRKFTVEQFSELAGVEEEQAKKILNFVNSKSNSHSAWLTFMYPRLYIAKQLLRDDGVIFVSIDDNEVAQLRILMDEIFGEENFVGQIIRQSKVGGGSDSKFFVKEHEYCLCFSKNQNYLLDFFISHNEDYLKRYKEEDEKGRYFWDTLARGGLKNPIKFPVKTPDGKILEGNWNRSEARFYKDLAEGEIEFRKNKKDEWNIYFKQRLNLDGKKPRSLTSNLGSTIDGKNDIKRLFENDKIFSYPKPTKFIKFLIEIVSSSNDIILDFFAGSGTTGDAVMQLNAEDLVNGKEGNRKYILVQLPELIDAKKNKTAYDFVKNDLKIAEPTIFEITKERLIRAGKKIQTEQKAGLFSGKNKLDLGFKIFETQPIWEDYEFEAEELEATQKLFDESKLSKEDLQTLLTTWKTYDNIPLTENLEKIDLDGYTGYYGNEKLYLVDKKFETKNLKATLNRIDEDKKFNPISIIVFGYHFESKILREIAENVSNYANKKKLDIDFITRY